MICFAVCDRCDGVGVGCQIVKFRGLIVQGKRILIAICAKGLA
jgi:hypothetical protein